MTDDKLIIKILNGNKDLYGNLMEKYYKELFHFVYNIVNNYETTEDLLQEVFLKTYNNLKKYNSEKAQFRTWLYRIANNHVFNYLKSRQYSQTKMTGYLEVELLSVEDIEKKILQDEQITEIISIMKKVLSKKHLRIMQLHFFSDLTIQEISESEDIPIKTIYKAIKTSIEKIKKEVKTYEKTNR